MELRQRQRLDHILTIAIDHGFESRLEGDRVAIDVPWTSSDKPTIIVTEYVTNHRELRNTLGY